MRILFLMAVMFTCFTSRLYAQNGGKISGSVTSTEKSLENTGATITLLRAKDSATVKLSVANKEGVFAFENIADGKYLVSVTSVGYQKAFSNLIEIAPGKQTIQLPAIALTPATQSLGGVTVTGKRPLIENKIDRTVVNVDASVMNIGTSALEVLEKSPGVSVDRDGNITLKGKEGVMIMVDGRPTQLSGADLANLLRNMSSNQLDQIEIMTNPPARYDAAGGSGVINIKTKKIVTAGYNGTVNLSYTQGRYPKTAEGINFNYREGKVNVFSSLNHNYQKGFGNIRIDRNIFNNSNSIENIFNQRANRVSEGNAYNAKLGLDFFATKKTTLGVVVSGNVRNMLAEERNTTNISNASKVLESITNATVDSDMDWKSFNTNLNFRHALDAKGKELTADVDLLKYRSGIDQFMVNSYTDAAGNPYRKADTLMGDLPQEVTAYSGRIDYLRPMKKGARFEAGIKSGVVKTDNNANYDSIQYGKIVHDFKRSNHFVYEENINAAYVNFSTPLSKKISAQLGLRLENTVSKGIQKTTNVPVDNNYTQLFPTAYFQYKVNDKNNFAVNFGRRVQRPNYQSLNPFIRFIDRYTYQRGNPDLKPSVSNNFEISHSWKNQITTTLNYSYTTDIIDGVIEQVGQEAYRTPANISSLNQFGLSINANTPITKWWTSSINVNIFNNNYKGVVSKAPVDFAATSFVVNATQQFKITKSLTGEVNGRYRNGWLEGVMRAKPVGFVGAGLSQQVFKNQGTLRLTIRDIFYTQRFRGRSQYGNVDFNIEQVNESRVVSVGFSYRFNKGKKIAPVKRTAGSLNEEQGRLDQ